MGFHGSASTIPNARPTTKSFALCLQPNIYCLYTTPATPVSSRDRYGITTLLGWQAFKDHGDVNVMDLAEEGKEIKRGIGFLPGEPHWCHTKSKAAFLSTRDDE
jgi:hypothetical protein